MSSFSLKKKELIEILKQQGITDKNVLNAFMKVKREEFVPEEFRNRAYDNNALPIGGSQTISQPYTVAMMTQILDVQKGHTVLEIGTGSGYQTAILCEMGAKVYSIERIDELARTAAEILHRIGCKVKIKIGDGTQGWKDYAPYDRIIVTAGSPKIPMPLLEQIEIDGKMIIPIGDKDSQMMTLIKKTITKEGEVKFLQKKFDEYRFVPLIGHGGWDGTSGKQQQDKE
jgi:protein-L-isoaspartate(D-aspartate) O-methyltransferase